jgi:hypothetical protein
MCPGPASPTTDAQLMVAVVRSPGLSGSGEDVLELNQTITYYGPEDGEPLAGLKTPLLFVGMP